MKLRNRLINIFIGFVIALAVLFRQKYLLNALKVLQMEGKVDVIEIRDKNVKN